MFNGFDRYVPQGICPKSLPVHGETAGHGSPRVTHREGEGEAALHALGLRVLEHHPRKASKRNRVAVSGLGC